MATSKAPSQTKKITTQTLRDMKRAREIFTALTCYDAPMAQLLNAKGIDIILVGDSVANVKLGYENTLPVTLQEMLHHLKAVKRGNSKSLLVVDMPFGTYEHDIDRAVSNAKRLVKEGGAEAVKIEGGLDVVPVVRALVKARVAVMGHLGLTPQSIHTLGGYRVQGRSRSQAQELLKSAKTLQKAGVFSVVLEAIPAPLAHRITKTLFVPTIGIGAGPHCDGQVLVLDDMLGMGPGPFPKFVKKYASLWETVGQAVQSYRHDVKCGRFPKEKNAYK